MINCKNTLLALLCIFAFAHTNAQKYSNEFLTIGVGGRAHGMAGANIALADDHTATYWNPAGLARIESSLEVGAMHAEWFAGIAKYDYLGIAKKLGTDGRSVLGVSVIRLGIDQIPNTLRLIESDGTINFDNVTEFSAADYSFAFSYARQLYQKADKQLSVGANAKIIHRSIGSFASAWGFGLDAGIQYQTGRWRLAAAARDIPVTFNAWNFKLTEEEEQVFRATDNDIPENSLEVTNPTITLGAAREFRLGENWDLAAEIDAVFTTDGQRNVLVSSSTLNIAPALGMELGFKEIAHLRAGIGNFQRISDEINPEEDNLNFQPTMGVGLQLGKFGIDYAFTDLGNTSEGLYSHVFSLTLGFD